MAGKRAFFILLLASTVLLAGFGAGAQGPDGVPPKDAAIEGAQAITSAMGDEFQISNTTSPEADRYAPAVAYNWRHREFLVVWHNKWPDGHRDIYARRVSVTGKLLSWFAISAGPNDRSNPAVAYNATSDEYLVVWMYNANGDAKTYDIWGRIVAWDGSYQKTPTQLISWSNRTFWIPRAAWNSIYNEYMVVWGAMDATTFLPTDIAFAIVNAGGAKAYGAVITTANQPHQPDITYNVAKNEYFVVWTSTTAVGNGDIKAARLDGYNGGVVGSVITVGNAPEDARLPSVATNQQHRYFVAWEQVFPGPCCDWDIMGRELDANGGLLGSELGIAQSYDDEAKPRVAARAGVNREYVVVWQRPTAGGETVRGVWIHDGTKPLDIAAVAFWDAVAPVVAADRTGFLTVYEGDATGDPTVYRHIYGRRWVPNMAALPVVLRKR